MGRAGQKIDWPLQDRQDGGDPPDRPGGPPRPSLRLRPPGWGPSNPWLMSPEMNEPDIEDGVVKFNIWPFLFEKGQPRAPAGLHRGQAAVCGRRPERVPVPLRKGGHNRPLQELHGLLYEHCQMGDNRQ